MGYVKKQKRACRVCEKKGATLETGAIRTWELEKTYHCGQHLFLTVADDTMMRYTIVHQKLTSLSQNKGAYQRRGRAAMISCGGGSPAHLRKISMTTTAT